MCLTKTNILVHPLALDPNEKSEIVAKVIFDPVVQLQEDMVKRIANYKSVMKKDLNIKGPYNLMRAVSANCKIGEKIDIKNVSKIFINNCILSDKVCIRADLAEIRLESFCILGMGVILHPSFGDDKRSFIGIRIGSYNIIGSNTIIKCTIIGNFNRIGKNCVIGEKVEYLKNYFSKIRL